MSRAARLDTPGTLHHVILRGIERRQIVNDADDRRQFVDRLGQLASALQTSIYAWALLSNQNRKLGALRLSWLFVWTTSLPVLSVVFTVRVVIVHATLSGVMQEIGRGE
jgi:REP element-mobilizing transposase RayT